MNASSDYQQFQRLSEAATQWHREGWCQGFLVGITLGLLYGWLIL